MSSVLRRSGDLSAVQRHTVGDTKTSMVQLDHIGWLLCDGRTLNIDEYRALYYVIGTSFGSDGPGTFKLPDSRGRVPGFVGQADNTVNPTNTWIMGDISGEESHRLTIAEMPKHNHTVIGDISADFGFTDLSGQHTHTQTSANDDFNNSSGTYPVGSNPSYAAYDSGSRTWSSTINAAGAHRHQIAANGGNELHNNLQPTIFLGNLFVYSGRLFRGPNAAFPNFPYQFDPPAVLF